jgi:deazaflavin-dependent oxidoreductase (nitroreductase family)
MVSKRERRKDRLFRVGNRIHNWVFTKSKGRVFGRAGGMAVVLLHTVGAKSGQPRQTMLTAPVIEPDGRGGERIVLVASFGGDRRNPAWFHNLVAQPNVSVTRAGKVHPVVARVADDDERARLWPRITEAYKGYSGYQAKTDRTIPVVILEPRFG